MKAVVYMLLGFFLIECGAVSVQGNEAREAEKIAERLLGEAQDVAEKEEERNNLATEKAFALVAVAFGWSDAGMKARADAAFGRVAEVAAKISSRHELDSVWERMAVEHARRSDVDGALKAQKQIADPETGNKSLREMIRIFLVQRNSAAAVTTALQLPASQESGGRPSESALESIVKWQSENGELAGASRIAELMVSDWLLAPALTAIAVGQAKHGESATAAQTLGPIWNPGYLVPALVALGEASAGAGDRVAARSVFEHARVLAQSLRDFNGSRGSSAVQALATIAHAQWAAGDAESCAETFDLARKLANPARGAGRGAAIDQCVLAAAEASVGNFDRTMARIDPFRDPEQGWNRASLCISIATAAATSGQQKRADQAFARAATESAALKPASTRGQGFEALSRALLKTGRIEEALKNADKLISREWSDLLRDAIALLAKDGKVPAALAVLKSISISDSATMREARELIAVAQFRSGDLAAALQMASDDTGRPGSALRQILAAQIAARDADGALQTFPCIHAAANTEHAMLIAEVAAIQVKGADWSAAYAWATRQTRPAPKAHALAGVARGLLKK